MRTGDRVVMTEHGRMMAKERTLLSAAGEVRDVFKPGQRNEQVYVRRDDGGCEWWPTKAWTAKESVDEGGLTMAEPEGAPERVLELRQPKTIEEIRRDVEVWTVETFQVGEWPHTDSSIVRQRTLLAALARVEGERACEHCGLPLTCNAAVNEELAGYKAMFDDNTTERDAAIRQCAALQTQVEGLRGALLGLVESIRHQGLANHIIIADTVVRILEGNSKILTYWSALAASAPAGGEEKA